MSGTSELRTSRIGTIPRERTLTRSEADAAQIKFDGSWAAFIATCSDPSDPFNYYIHNALWQQAFGAEQIVVVD